MLFLRLYNVCGKLIYISLFEFSTISHPNPT
uniref:Uncharacterized protein n=1 Tax=Anguilla anguilla TaxID=7936 RepID=A0A0E9S898_ANGAN